MADQPIHIENGPDKYDLMASLGEGNPSPRKVVTFSVENGHTSDLRTDTITVAIYGLEQENGSGTSWLFKGYLKGYKISRGRIHGYYSTQTRAGWYKRGER